MATRKPKTASAKAQTGSYVHEDAKALIRPEVGVQTYAATQGKFKRAPAKYCYDDSLAPELASDSQNPAREQAEALVAQIEEVSRALTHSGNDVPCWLLDTDYNGMVLHANQAFFPRTAACDNLKRSLKAESDDSVWTHLSGNVSAPFTLGRHGKIAVKVIDDRGNELMVVKELKP